MTLRPDGPRENPTMAAALRALRLPRRKPTEADRPRRPSVVPTPIAGQMSIFDLTDEDARGPRRAS
jgi:hypothetical protein